MTTSTQPPQHQPQSNDPNPLSPANNPNRLLLIGALGGAAAVLLLVLAVLIGFWMGRSSQPSTQTTAQPATATTTTPPAATILPPVVIEPLADPVTTSTTDPLLTAPLPTDPALAAEEADRLSDEQQRLAAQKQTLSQQVTDSNQLIELKAEQIRLLEAELAKTP